MPPLRLTRRQSREVDRIAIEEYGIAGIVLMENAARSVLDAIADLTTTKLMICVMCGPGNNGGDGLAVARHLLNQAHKHYVYVGLAAKRDRYTGDAATNLAILEKMRPTRPGLFIREQSTVENDETEGLSAWNIFIDAMFGSGLNRPIEGPMRLDIERMNRHRSPRSTVVSLDIPSGLDCDTGEPLGACIRADRTITFAAEKAGFANDASKRFTGRLTIGDIGVPLAAIEKAAGGLP